MPIDAINWLTVIYGDWKSRRDMGLALEKMWLRLSNMGFHIPMGRRG